MGFQTNSGGRPLMPNLISEAPVAAATSFSATSAQSLAPLATLEHPGEGPRAGGRIDNERKGEPHAGGATEAAERPKTSISPPAGAASPAQDNAETGETLARP
eukprot:1104793-Pyramimonas_sp.AAC.1